ncbi:MAG: class I SAM-dependent methyltransferase [Candidatus Methanomethylicaceae archaeon]
MTQQKTSSSEEKFYDLVGKRLLNIEDLLVGGPARFLAGSMDAFKYMLERIGSVQGKRILDYGCGSGWLGVYLAKHGAQVEGFDISGKLIEVATQRAKMNGVEHLCNFRKMPAENLEYPDESFDLVVGISILHHIELPPAVFHLKRVMREGALAIFIEPLGENPVLNWMREKVFNVHYGLKKDKTTERPLTYDDIHTLGRNFSDYNWREFQLLSMVRRFTGDHLAESAGLQKLDDWLIAKFPGLRRFCRLVVIELRK